LLEVGRSLKGGHWSEMGGGQECRLSEGNRRLAAGAMSLLQARKVLAYVESNLSGPVLVGNLARVAGLSCGQFHRVFLRRFGVTPHRYVTLRRIRMSQSLMLTTDEPLSQISIG
jgi:AraC family transcriptional regulator